MLIDSSRAIHFFVWLPFNRKIRLEHFILHELKSYLSYRRIKKSLTFWRSSSQHEVDFLIGRDLAIEVKASQRINPRFLNGLKALNEENIFKKLFLISNDPIEQKIDGIHCMPVETFLDQLWDDQLL